MMNDWRPLLPLSLAFLGLFAIAELLYRAGKVNAEHTRKLVHAGTGFLTLLFPLFLSKVWQVAVLCGSFLFLLIASLAFHWLPSINAVKRKTAGSWLYPIVVVLCFVFYKRAAVPPEPLFHQLYYFYLPLLLLAICDPVAALAGSNWKKRHPESAPGKTFAGSLSFFGTACAIVILLMLLFTNDILPHYALAAMAITTAFAATLAERFSNGGWDNFTIPATAMACMYLTDHIL